MNCAPYPRKSGLKRQPLPSAPTSSRKPLNGVPACLPGGSDQGPGGTAGRKPFNVWNPPGELQEIYYLVITSTGANIFTFRVLVRVVEALVDFHRVVALHWGTRSPSRWSAKGICFYDISAFRRDSLQKTDFTLKLAYG